MYMATLRKYGCKRVEMEMQRLQPRELTKVYLCEARVVRNTYAKVDKNTTDSAEFAAEADDPQESECSIPERSPSITVNSDIGRSQNSPTLGKMSRLCVNKSSASSKWKDAQARSAYRVATCTKQAEFLECHAKSIAEPATSQAPETRVGIHFCKNNILD